MGNATIKAYIKTIQTFITLCQSCIFTVSSKLCQSLHFIAPSKFGKVSPSKIDSNFSKAEFYHSLSFGKVSSKFYPGQKMIQKIWHTGDSNFGKTAFYGLDELCQSLHFIALSNFGKVSSCPKMVQTSPKLNSTAP